MEQLNTKHEVWDGLVTQLQKLNEVACKIQVDGQFKVEQGLTNDEISGFVKKYLDWYSECLAILPKAIQCVFRAEYERKIKYFLMKPVATNFSPYIERFDDAGDDFRYPYTEWFYEPTFAQKQMLLEASKHPAQLTAIPPMELSANQRLYLQTIFDFFHQNGIWPTYKYVDRKLTQIRRDLDIEAISKSLPMGFATAFAFNHDLSAQATLSISAIHACNDSADDLADFIRTLTFSVERYFGSDENDVKISSNDLIQHLGMSDLSAHKVGLLIKDAFEYPIYSVFGGGDNEYRAWECTLSRNIRYFDGVTSIERYLERIDHLRTPPVTTPGLAFDTPNEIDAQHNNPRNAARIFTSAEKDDLVFQILIHELLQIMGFIDVFVAKRKDEGYNFQASYPINSAFSTTQQVWIIEIKYKHSRMTSTDRMISVEALRQLAAYAQVKKVDKALLITNISLTSIAKEFVAQVNAEIGGKLEVWDSDKLSSLILQFPNLQTKYVYTIDRFFPSLSKPLETSQTKLIEQLAECQLGQNDCYKYEDTCVAILTEVFSPPLKQAKLQARTLNGLERRDALFPMRGIKHGWEEIHQEFNANFLLCEFKNYKEQFDKDEVNQTRNYLKDTIGRIGIIFSRKGASESALRMRNVIFTQEQKVILFFEDKHLIELLKMKRANQNPLELIQDAINEFYISYE